MNKNTFYGGFRGVVMAMMLLISTVAFAQITATGNVVDEALGEPIIGASILEKGTSNGTITDFDGNFTLNVATGATLVISYMGYQTVEMPAKANMVINMKEDAVALTEVVAIGYGSQKKKEVTGAVASLKADDFNAGVKSSPVGLLQGKVAGLNISRQGSDPTNTGYNIQIRGFSSLGMGTGSSPLYIVDGVPVSNIDNIAPEEIASMDVLKDGSAAAIYGTRGTNGVIIITTKRSEAGGSECGKMSVEYNGYLSVSAPRTNTGMATADEYRNLYELSGGKVKPNVYDGGYSTDWMGEMMRPAALTHHHNVAISGSTKNFGYRGAVSYKDAQGIAKTSGRQEVMAKLAANQKTLEGWLELQYDFSYMYYKNNYQCGDFKQAATLNPTYPIYDENTTSGYFIPSGSGQSNPIASLYQKESYQTGNFFRGSVKATVNIKAVPGLKVNAFAAFEGGDNYSYYYCSQKFDTDKQAAGQATRNTDMSLNQLYEATVDYAGSWDNHNLVAVAGFSYQKFFSDGNYIANAGFPTDTYKYFSMGDGLTDKSQLNVSSYRGSNALAAAFARMNYNYDEKYLLSASLRYEGSTRFGENNKWGWFPAVSAGWRIAGEDFMRDQDWCNDLKLRAGFGITGNNLKDDLMSQQLLTNGGTFWYNGEWVTTYAVTQNKNPNLRWEKKFEYNLGVDYSFLDNRLYGALDLYYRDTKDLLWDYDVPTPPYQYPKYRANAGRIASKGIELAVSGVPVRTKDWEWTSTFTIAFNNNKILKLSDPSIGLNYSEMETGGVGENGMMGVNTQKIVEGQSVGVFYGYKVYGVTPEGDLLYYATDENGNLTYTSNAKKADYQVIGHAQPLFTYGWNNTIRWKNLDLTLFFRGVCGNDVLNVKRWAYAPQKTVGLNVFMKDIEALANGTGAYRQNELSDYYLEDGSYLKLDNITLGYTIPFKDNKYIQSIRVHATAENVFTLTSYSGIDPEINTADVWSAGIDATGFYPSVCNVLVGVGITL